MHTKYVCKAPMPTPVLHKFECRTIDADLIKGKSMAIKKALHDKMIEAQTHQANNTAEGAEVLTQIHNSDITHKGMQNLKSTLLNGKSIDNSTIVMEMTALVEAVAKHEKDLEVLKAGEKNRVNKAMEHDKDLLETDTTQLKFAREQIVLDIEKLINDKGQQFTTDHMKLMEELAVGEAAQTAIRARLDELRRQHDETVNKIRVEGDSSLAAVITDAQMKVMIRQYNLSMSREVVNEDYRIDVDNITRAMDVKTSRFLNIESLLVDSNLVMSTEEVDDKVIDGVCPPTPPWPGVVNLTKHVPPPPPPAPVKK